MEQVKDRSVEFSNRFRLVNVADGSTLGIFDLDEITGEIYEVGTPLDAKLFDSINADILKCVAKIKLNGTTLILEDKDGNELDTVDLSTLTFDVELENYYTKSETDALIASEKERAETKENSLAENITAGIAEAKDYTDNETRRAQMAEKVNSDLIAANSKDIADTAAALADEITRAKLVEGDIIADTDTELNKCVTEITLDETLYALNLKNKNDADIGSVDLMPLASSTGSVSILYTETPELYQIVTISYAQWAEISRTPAKAVHINDNVYASNGYIYNVYNNNYIANDTNNIQLRCTYVPVNHAEVTAAVNVEKERAQTVENSLSARITTAQDTADEAESIARGRSQARVFDTKSDMDLWLADETHTALLNVGDNLYIKDVGVPDYWWNGDGVSPLEAEKPDLTEYYTKTQTDGKISTAKTEANTYTDTQIVEEATAREALGEELTAELQTANTQINQNSANIDSIYEEISELDTKKYQKPDSGIPKSDLSSGVQSSLDKADTAIQTETDPTVPAWAKTSEKPTYTKSEVGLGNVDNIQQYSENNPPPYPVISVNGEMGAVELTAADVGAVNKAGDAMTGALELPMLLGSGSTAAKGVVPVRYLTRQDLGLSTVTADIYLQAWLKKVCELYPNTQDCIFIGGGNPTSRIMIYALIYDTSNLNTDGMPQYVIGIARQQGNDVLQFGTNNHVYTSEKLLNNSENIDIVNSTGNVYVAVGRSDKDVKIGLDIGSGGTNRGLYDKSPNINEWIVYWNNTDLYLYSSDRNSGKVYLNGVEPYSTNNPPKKTAKTWSRQVTNTTTSVTAGNAYNLSALGITGLDDYIGGLLTVASNKLFYIISATQCVCLVGGTLSSGRIAVEINYWTIG